MGQLHRSDLKKTWKRLYEGVTGQGFYIAAERGPCHVLAKDGLGRLLLFALLHAAPAFPSTWSPALSTMRPT